MKFGDTLAQRSVPEFAISRSCVRIFQAYRLIIHAISDNIDYYDLKRTIKLHTSSDHTKPQTIPTTQNITRAAQDFEDGFFSELKGQHKRVNEFVHVKYGEITRRLGKVSCFISHYPDQPCDCCNLIAQGKAKQC